MINTSTTFVYVGCGGTFWAAHPYLSQLWFRQRPALSVFLDPGKIAHEDVHRQWCSVAEACNSEQYKVVKAALAITGSIDTCPSGPTRESCHAGYVGRILGDDIVQERIINDNPPMVVSWPYPFEDRQDFLTMLVGATTVVMFVNVDNDEARLQIKKWVESREVGTTIVIMSGCDLTHGQVYYGAWKNGEPLHDFFPLHPDIGEERNQEERRCGEQSIMANALTGQLAGVAYERALHSLKADDWSVVYEFYWYVDPTDSLRMWTSCLQGSKKKERIQPDDG